MPKKSRSNTTDRDALFETSKNEYGLDTYQYLWFRVVYQAVHDAEYLRNTNVTKRNQAKDAIRWLLLDEEDFDPVCLAAGFDPDWFRDRVTKYLVKRYNAELLRTVVAPHPKRGAKERKI